MIITNSKTHIYTVTFIIPGENRTEKLIQHSPIVLSSSTLFPCSSFKGPILSLTPTLLLTYPKNVLLSFLIFAASFSSNFLLDLRNSLMATFLSLLNCTYPDNLVSQYISSMLDISSSALYTPYDPSTLVSSSYCLQTLVHTFLSCRSPH